MAGEKTRNQHFTSTKRKNKHTPTTDLLKKVNGIGSRGLGEGMKVYGGRGALDE